MVLEHSGEHPTQWAAISSVAGKIGCTGEARRFWVRQAERDRGLSESGLDPPAAGAARRRRGAQQAAAGSGVGALATTDCVTTSCIARVTRLGFLAPDIVATILNGRQPAGLTANKLANDSRLPIA